MIDEKRFKTTPVQHIRNLLNSIKDGKLTITYYNEMSEPTDTITYDVSCTAADADEFISKYEALTKALYAIGKSREKLESEAKIEDVLTPDQIDVWNTYFWDFDKDFDAGEYSLGELYAKLWNELELSEEENAVLERYDEWFDEQCLKHLPSKTRHPRFLVSCARRYQHFVSRNAPQIILDHDGCLLAEQMILFYSAK